MTWRRLLIPAVILLVVISAVSATTSPDRVTRPSPTIPPAPSSPAPEVSATLPRRAPLRATVGDVVRLVVNSAASDTVVVDALGLESPVDETVPAELVFVADRPGRFRVRLRESDEAIGTVVVSA